MKRGVPPRLPAPPATLLLRRIHLTVESVELAAAGARTSDRSLHRGSRSATILGVGAANLPWSAAGMSNAAYSRSPAQVAARAVGDLSAAIAALLDVDAVAVADSIPDDRLWEQLAAVRR